MSAFLVFKTKAQKRSPEPWLVLTKKMPLKLSVKVYSSRMDSSLSSMGYE